MHPLCWSPLRDAMVQCNSFRARLHLAAREGTSATMLTKTDKSSLAFPVAEPPPAGQAVEIAPGILWSRIPLPVRLNHINVYLIEDGDGWAILDTGIDNAATRGVWDALVAGPLAGRRLTRLIVTHFHPDHIGLAGWLCERFGL